MARKNTKKKSYKKDEKGVAYDKKTERTGSEAPSAEEKSQDTGSKGQAEAKTAIASSIPSPHNDPEWYSQDPQLMQDAGRINFSKPFGSAISLDIHGGRGGYAPSTSGYHDNDEGISGILVANVFPSVGDSQNPRSAINVAAQAFYTHVRYVNSGRKNYDPCDLMLYGITMGELYAFTFWMIRIYNAAFMYSQRNWFYGKTMLQAMKVTPDIVNNLAELRYFINICIAKISSFAIPSDIMYFRRKAFMYSGVYTESSIGLLKDQLYMFNPEAFYKFSLDQRQRGQLTYMDVKRTAQYEANSYTGLKDLRDMFNELTANVTGDEDFGLMSGDILKAYGDKIIGISNIGDEGALIAIHDPYVLNQFRHATLVGGVYGHGVNETSGTFTRPATGGTTELFYVGRVQQDVYGSLICVNVSDPWSGHDANVNLDAVMTADSDIPDPAYIMESSRLIVRLSENIPTDLNTPASSEVLDCGTEIITSVTIYWFNDAGDNLTNVEIGTNAYDRIGITNPLSTLENFAHLQQFRFAPIMLMVSRDSANTNIISRAVILSNLENHVEVSPAVISRTHEAALFSLFFVPGVARVLGYSSAGSESK